MQKLSIPANPDDERGSKRRLRSIKREAKLVPEGPPVPEFPDSEAQGRASVMKVGLCAHFINACISFLLTRSRARFGNEMRPEDA